jgi:hypothetical protein
VSRELSVLPQQVLAALCLRNSVAVCGGTLPDYEKFVVYFVVRYTKYCFISVLYILIWFSTVSRNFYAVIFTVASNSLSGFAKMH